MFRCCKDKQFFQFMQEKRTKFGILISFLYFCRQIVKQEDQDGKETKTRYTMCTGWL